MGSVGKSIHHESAEGHVKGSAQFIDDFTPGKNELLVGFAGSPWAKGTVTGIDTSEALKIPGVVAVYDHTDIPGKKFYGPIFHDEVFLVEKQCEYLGQPVVLIAAETKEALAAAIKAVKIEGKGEKPVFTIEDALKAKTFLGPRRTISRNDAKAAIKKATYQIESEFYCGGQEQFYLESQIAYAFPDEQGRVVVHSSTQNPTEIQAVVAEVLALGQHEVVCICKRMGGGFGGKETQGVHPALMASLVAIRTGRPARCMYDKDLDMQITGKRHPYLCRYKVGFSEDGVIEGADFEFYSNGGAAADLSTSVLERTMLHAENSYYIENIHIEAQVCKTNIPPNTAFRGFGGPQGAAAIENILEEIAQLTGEDAAVIRGRNLYGESPRNVAPYGQIISENPLPEMFNRIFKSSDYEKRRAEIDAFNAKSKTRLKGLALTSVKFGISFTTKHLNQGNALVNVYTDGTVQVSTGGTEMGQGLYTKIQQIAADEFAIPIDQVRVMPTSTEKNNNASPTAASAGTDLNGNATVIACTKIRERMAEFAGRYYADNDAGILPSDEYIVFENGYVYDSRKPDEKLTFGEMANLAYRDRVSLGERGFYRTPGVDFNRDTGKGNPFLYYTNGFAVAEVDIDVLTGMYSIPRYDALMDYGKSINPAIDIGQATGGIVQGIGWASNEELRYGKDGSLLSHSPTTYKIPNIQDMPEDFRVELFPNDSNIRNVRRSKAVAEPPLLLGLAVFAAVKNALSYVNPDVVAKPNLPVTAEEVLLRYNELKTSPKGAGKDGSHIGKIASNNGNGFARSLPKVLADRNRLTLC